MAIRSKGVMATPNYHVHDVYSSKIFDVIIKRTLRTIFTQPFHHYS